jgi:hypothetical protein
MIDFVELLKVIGSASGLFATGFLLWDRYYKHFPIAIIVARPVMPGSVNVNHRLLLKNVSDRPILITWEHGDRTQLRVAKDDSIHGVVRSQLRGETVVALDAGDEVFLRWRFAQPRVWKPDRTIPISIRKRDFDAMVDAYLSASAPDDD